MNIFKSKKPMVILAVAIVIVSTAVFILNSKQHSLNAMCNTATLTCNLSPKGESAEDIKKNNSQHDLELIKHFIQCSNAIHIARHTAASFTTLTVSENHEAEYLENLKLALEIIYPKAASEYYISSVHFGDYMPTPSGMIIATLNDSFMSENSRLPYIPRGSYIFAQGYTTSQQFEFKRKIQTICMEFIYKKSAHLSAKEKKAMETRISPLAEFSLPWLE